MENKNKLINESVSNSPNLNSTPLRRVGLSRKIKSTPSEDLLKKKVSRPLEEPCSPSSTPKKVKINFDGDQESQFDENDIQRFEKSIAEKELKLDNLQNKNSNYKELIKLIDLWKTGCKDSLLHLTNLLEQKQVLNLDCNLVTILKRLGVWETVFGEFENDSELALTDYE